MEGYFYTYILQSERDGKNYAGYTKDLNLRFEQHQNGEVKATQYRRPLKLIYFEACLNQEDAIRREKYFKTHYGKMSIKKRLNNWYKQLCSKCISQG